MRSLEEIIRQNNEAAANHDQTLLSDLGKRSQPTHLPSTKAKLTTSRFLFGVEVLLDHARHALGFNFDFKGLAEVLRIERNIPAGEPVSIDPLLTFVYALGCSSELVDEWVADLSAVLAPYVDRSEQSFTIRTPRVLITIKDNVVSEISPLPKRPSSERRG